MTSRTLWWTLILAAVLASASPALAKKDDEPVPRPTPDVADELYPIVEGGKCRQVEAQGHDSVLRGHADVMAVEQLIANRRRDGDDGCRNGGGTGRAEEAPPGGGD